METEQYVIRGGIEGRERLRILSRVMQPTTLELLRRAGLKPGLSCLEIGCGGGDVACDMARMVGPSGHVLATDIDGPQLDIARREAEAKGIANMAFVHSDITREIPDGPFDFIHVRFVLTHIPDPAETLARIKSVLKPGGAIALEEIDFSGHFCHPDCPALWRYVEIYTETVKRRGGDANIGPRLPGLALAAGFANVDMNVVQRAGHEGEVKLITPITMQNIAPAVLRAGIASEAEINTIVQELYDYARTPGTIGCLARVFEVWANA